MSYYTASDLLRHFVNAVRSNPVLEEGTSDCWRPYIGEVLVRTAEQLLEEESAATPDQDIRKAAVADLRLAAAKAWCVVKFPYDCHHTQEQVNRHVTYDARSTVNDAWFVQAVDGFLAGISHVARQDADRLKRFEDRARCGDGSFNHSLVRVETTDRSLNIVRCENAGCEHAYQLEPENE